MNNTVNYLDLCNEDQCNEVFRQILDNGDWEYVRLGFGEDAVGMYLVDLEDTGDQLKQKFYINDKFSVADVFAEGVELNVFEKCGKDDYRLRMDEEAGDFFDLLLRVQA